MTNPKGTAFETLLVETANAFDPTTGLYRPAKVGAKDHGDIHGADPFTIQAKDWANLSGALNEGLAGAVRQAEVHGTDYGIAVVKRRNKSVGDAYAVLRYEDFIRVLLRLRRAESYEWDKTELDRMTANDRTIPFPKRKPPA